MATVNDSTTEADGTVTVTLHDGTGYTIGSANAATIAIDDDYTLSVTIDNTEGIEGDSSGLTDAATLTFTVNPPRPRDFSFLICLDGGTAEHGDGDSRDYQFMPPNNPRVVAGGSGCVNTGLQALLPANTPSVEAKILVNGDSLFEADETVIVSLQRVTGVPSQNTPDDVIISPTAGTVTYIIRNDDFPLITLCIIYHQVEPEVDPSEKKYKIDNRNYSACEAEPGSGSSIRNRNKRYDCDRCSRIR